MGETSPPKQEEVDHLERTALPPDARHQVNQNEKEGADEETNR